MVLSYFSWSYLEAVLGHLGLFSNAFVSVDYTCSSGFFKLIESRILKPNDFHSTEFSLLSLYESTLQEGVTFDASVGPCVTLTF